MKKATLVILLSTILVVSLAASMVLSEPISEQTRQRDQECGEYCDPDCEPTEHDYGYHHEYLCSGPHAREVMSYANAVTDAHGPAPSSGDCDPDGSGFDRTDWPNEDSPGMGPAPNSGDGDPDGSGF